MPHTVTVVILFHFADRRSADMGTSQHLWSYALKFQHNICTAMFSKLWQRNKRTKTTVNSRVTNYISMRAAQHVRFIVDLCYDR